MFLLLVGIVVADTSNGRVGFDFRMLLGETGTGSLFGSGTAPSAP